MNLDSSKKRLLAILGAITAIATVVAAYGGAFQTVSSFWGWISADNATAPQKPKLILMNLTPEAAIEVGTERTEGVNLVTLAADVTNVSPVLAHMTVQDIEASITGSSCEDDAVAWRMLPVAPKIGVEVAFCNIVVEVEPGEIAEGRFRLVLEYGGDPKLTDQRLTVSGALFVNGSTKRVTWLPDSNSAHPHGQLATPATGNIVQQIDQVRASTN